MIVKKKWIPAFKQNWFQIVFSLILHIEIGEKTGAILKPVEFNETVHTWSDNYNFSFLFAPVFIVYVIFLQAKKFLLDVWPNEMIFDGRWCHPPKKMVKMVKSCL